MANEVLVGLKIGAAVSGTLHAAFGSARSTVQQLGRATDGLTTKQKQLGSELAASVARGGSGIERMRRQYDQVGRTLDQLKTKQDRLNVSIARGEALKDQRGALRGEFMEVAGTAAAIAAPVVLGVRQAIDFKDQTNDIAITGGFDAAEEERLGTVLRGAALKWNQTQTDMAAGAQVLIAGGLSNVKELEAYAPVMAKFATASRASMGDLGAVAIALNDNLGIGASGLERAFNMLADSGKQGQFELADMAKWLPQLTPQFAALGITGERAVAEIGASLQIARRGAGNNDEAANNFKNFLSKLTAPDTLKAFEGAGINLTETMQNMVGSGLTPVQAMLETVTRYVGTKGPAAAAEFEKAMALKDDTERQMALDRLNEAYKLGELFRDQQVLAAVRPMLANRGDLARFAQSSVKAADQGVGDTDWKKRMESPREQLKALNINLTELGITLGSVLLPAMVDVVQATLPVIQTFAAWAAENPGLIKGVVGLVGGLLAGKLAFIGLKYGINLVVTPLVSLTTTVTTLSAKWTVLRAMWQAGRFAPFIGAMTKVGGVVSWVGRAAFNDLRSGIRLAGQAILWLGRALLMNPIGLAITAIALGAYLIYRYWEPIKGFFSGLWAEVKAGFNGGLAGIGATLLNFSPLGLFYRAFATTLSWFGIELPSRFSEFGGMLISGLVGGITSRLGAARDAVLGIGASIKGWFTETLGNGANISEGAALGITAQAGLVRKAALSMAMASAVPLAPPDMATVSRVSGAQGTSTAPMTIHFSPTIQVQGGGDVQAAVQQGLRLSFQEFERMMDQYQRDRARRSYGDLS